LNKKFKEKFFMPFWLHAQDTSTSSSREKPNFLNEYVYSVKKKTENQKNNFYLSAEVVVEEIKNNFIS